jgi:hypothetical protein
MDVRIRILSARRSRCTDPSELEIPSESATKMADLNIIKFNLKDISPTSLA